MDGERSILDARLDYCSTRPGGYPGLDDMLVTGGYYELAFRREPGRWKIERLLEDNRWRRPTPPG